MRMSVVKSFYNWAVESEVIQKSPYPKLIATDGVASASVIPMAREILRVRSMQKVKRLREAVVFECLASGGFRTSEFNQLRCCDFDFSRKPMDYELGRYSPFAGARIDLSGGKGIHLKSFSGKRKRITYISKLAAKLLLRWMEVKNLDPKSPIPVFPIERKNIHYIIRTISEGALEGGASKLSSGNEGLKRMPAFTDLTDADLEAIDPKHREQIKKLQNEFKMKTRHSNLKFRSRRIEPGRKRTIHPHALRHFCAVLLYYRNYHGNRRDMLSVRDHLGHASVEMTEAYADGEVYIESDAQWKQIMMGNGTEYRFIAEN